MAQHGATSTSRQPGPRSPPPPNASPAASCKLCALSCSRPTHFVLSVKDKVVCAWPPSVTTSSLWPMVARMLKATRKDCAIRVTTPKACKNDCGRCAGRGSDRPALQGRGEVKSLAPANGNRPVPQIFTCAGFGWGGTPHRALRARSKAAAGRDAVDQHSTFCATCTPAAVSRSEILKVTHAFAATPAARCR